MSGEAAKEHGFTPYSLFTLDDIPPYLMEGFDRDLYQTIFYKEEIEDLKAEFVSYNFEAIIPGEESLI